MLLIVINDEKPKIKQPSQNAATELGRPMKVPKCPTEGDEQQSRGGKEVRPTSAREILCVNFRGQYDFFTASHGNLKGPRAQD